MRTLVFDADPLRARAYAVRVGEQGASVDVVTSPQQAAQLMKTGAYGRLAMRVDPVCPSGEAVLVARAAHQPACDLVDISRLPGRVQSTPRGQGGGVVVPVPTPNVP